MSDQPPAQYPQPPGGPPPQYAPQQWGPPPTPPGPREKPAHPHAEPREYHQMLRTWNYTWWKPIVGVAFLVVLFFVAQLVLVPLLLLAATQGPGSFLDNLGEIAEFDTITPGLLLYVNLTLGASIFATWVVIRVVHKMRPRWVTSVAPKMRWGFFWACVGVSVLALVAQVVAGLFVPGQQEVDMAGSLNEFTSTTVALAVVVLLTTPLQAAGEEFLFRGYLMQAIGSFFSFGPDRATQFLARWLAILATASLFALAHGVQNFPLFFDRFMFGLIAGWLVVRTGGLEAGIAMHILNNFLAFGFALSYGDISESLNVSEISWWNIPLTLTQALTYAALVLVLARVMHIQRRTTPPLQPARQAVESGPDPVPSEA